MKTATVDTKKMSVLGGTTLAISSVIGAGVFSLAGLAVEIGGPGISVLSWILTVIAIIPFLGVFYSLSKKYLERGSLLQYASDALGPWSHCGISILLVGTYIVLIPVVVLAGAEYLRGVLGLSAAVVPFMSLLFLVFGVAVNLMGIKWMTRLNWLSFVLLATILVLILAYNLNYMGHGFRALFLLLKDGNDAFTFGTVAKVSSLLLFSLIGWESVSFGVAEMRNPDRALSRIYLFSFLAVFTIYFGLALVVAGAASVAQSAGRVGGGFSTLLASIPYGKLLIYSTAIVILANVSACIFAGSRMLCAAGKSGVLSDVLVKTNRNHVPVVSLFYFFVFTAMVLLIKTSFEIQFDTLVQLANQNFMLIYILCLVNFFRSETRAYRWFILVPGLASTVFNLAGFNWLFVFPVILMMIGLGLTPSRAFRRAVKPLPDVLPFELVFAS